MAKPHVDPEYERWRKTYPSFPGVPKCIELLTRSNVQGSWIDIICDLLIQHAEANAGELIDATKTEIENDSQTARILLGIIAESKSICFFPFLADLLSSPRAEYHAYAIDGLKQLDTKESRRLIWKYETKNQNPNRGITNG